MKAAIRNQAQAQADAIADLFALFDCDFDADSESFDTVSDGDLLQLAEVLARDCEFNAVLKERLFF